MRVVMVIMRVVMVIMRVVMVVLYVLGKYGACKAKPTDPQHCEYLHSTSSHCVAPLRAPQTVSVACWRGAPYVWTGSRVYFSGSCVKRQNGTLIQDSRAN